MTRLLCVMDYPCNNPITFQYVHDETTFFHLTAGGNPYFQLATTNSKIEN